MRTDMFQQVLEELKGSSADVEASALISTDGLMIASALPAGMDEDRVGAMSAALLSLGDRAARELARGTLGTHPHRYRGLPQGRSHGRRCGTDRKFNRMRPSMARVLGLETRSAKEG